VWSFVFLKLGEQKGDAESKDDNQESHKIHKESLSLLLAVRGAEEKNLNVDDIYKKYGTSYLASVQKGDKYISFENSEEKKT
jgi:hypothetical protein